MNIYTLKMYELMLIYNVDKYKLSGDNMKEDIKRMIWEIEINILKSLYNKENSLLSKKIENKYNAMTGRNIADEKSIKNSTIVTAPIEYGRNAIIAQAAKNVASAIGLKFKNRSDSEMNNDDLLFVKIPKTFIGGLSLPVNAINNSGAAILMMDEGLLGNSFFQKDLLDLIQTNKDKVSGVKMNNIHITISEYEIPDIKSDMVNQIINNSNLSKSAKSKELSPQEEKEELNNSLKRSTVSNMKLK